MSVPPERQSDCDSCGAHKDWADSSTQPTRLHSWTCTKRNASPRDRHGTLVQYLSTVTDVLVLYTRAYAEPDSAGGDVVGGHNRNGTKVQ
jgi:hypothetical protein